MTDQEGKPREKKPRSSREATTMATGNLEPIIVVPTTVVKPSSIAKPKKNGVPAGLWQACPGCNGMIYTKESEKRFNVCPECDHHFYVSASASPRCWTKARSRSGMRN